MALRLIEIGISAVMVLLPSFGLVSGPAFAGLTVALLLLWLARCQSSQIRLRLRRFDWRLWCLAIAFCLWSALGAIGKVNAATVLHHGLQTALIFFGALLLIEVARQSAASVAPHQGRLIRLIALGLVLGPADSGHRSRPGLSTARDCRQE